MILKKYRINIKTFINSIKKLLSEFEALGFRFILLKLLISFSNSFVIKGNFLNAKETVKYIRSTNKSIIRYGDGEASLILGSSIHFQQYSPKLKQDLLKIIKNYNNNSPYLLSIPSNYIKMSNKELRRINRLDIWLPFKIIFKFYYHKKPIYGDSLTFRSLGTSGIKIDWLYENKNVIFVTNMHTSKIANLKVTKNLHKIIVREKNAYFYLKEVKDKIYEILKNYDKDNIIIILSCGPAAKVLAFELSNDGFRAIDIGYIFYKYLDR